jgi:ElaB/YqjD/DUF883 family membrane-anchored ribosome-binding protein
MTPTQTVERVQEEVARLRAQTASVLQDGVHAAERSLKRTRETLIDARDETAYRVKRQPLRAVAIAFAAGALVGLVLAAFRRHRNA